MERICIIGPSSSGKSTLAQALGEKFDLKVCFLDQMAHVPGTQWKRREEADFQRDHELFLLENDRWVMEGNYSFLMPSRFEKATLIIWLDFKIWGAVFRYIKRSFSKQRWGDLEGAKRRPSLDQLKYMLFVAPKLRPKYERLILESACKFIRLENFDELKKLYKDLDLNEKNKD
jgi:adenylate kinase family enzyme